MKPLLQIINTDNEPNILMDMDNQSKAQSFCAKAEAFVRWLNDEGLDSYWKDGKLLYYYIDVRDAEDMLPEVVLARFEDEQK